MHFASTSEQFFVFAKNHKFMYIISFLKIYIHSSILSSWASHMGPARMDMSLKFKTLL